MKLKEMYYRIKYRPGRGQSGAIGIIASDKKKNDFDKKLEDVKKFILPCYKENKAVLTYLKGRYNLKTVKLSEAEINEFKINYILSECPEVLATPEINLSSNAKMPTRSEFLKFQENSDRRFKEAREYPFEKLQLELSSYTFEVNLSGELFAEFRIIFENKSDRFFMTSRINQQLNESDSLLLRNVTDEIIVYKGIGKEDIDNKTKNFIIYSDALLNLLSDRKLTGCDKLTVYDKDGNLLFNSQI